MGVIATNPAWIKAVRMKVAELGLTKNELFDQSGCASRVYGSSVVNGRVISKTYSKKISDFLEIDVPYTVEIPETQIS